MEYIKRFFSDESGATMVEYGVLVALIAIAVIAIVTALGLQLDSLFNVVCLALGEAGATAGCVAAAPG